jgi:hypothetical protein
MQQCSQNKLFSNVWDFLGLGVCGTYPPPHFIETASSLTITLILTASMITKSKAAKIKGKHIGHLL